MVWDAATASVISQTVVNEYYAEDSRNVSDLSLSWVRDTIFSPNGSQIFSASGDGALGVWDALTGEELQSQTIAPFNAAAWSPYGARLVYLNIAPSETTTIRDESFNNLNIIVPFASLERLQNIATSCVRDAAIPTRAVSELARPLTSIEALPHFIAQVESLPDGAIPPACAADLLAIAFALIEN